MGIKISMQREVKERIRKEIIEAAQQYAEEYGIENYTDTASALNCVYAEFKHQFDWKIKQIGEYNAFIEWLKGLPMQFDYYYFDMRERIKYWFNQSDEEASKYSDEQVDKLYWNLLAREFFALVKKFNVSGIIKSEDDVKVTPYDMDDYLDNDNVLEESNIVSNEITSENLDEYYIPIEYEYVEDEDSDSDDPRPYVDYFKHRIYLDEVMRLDTPEVIDGIEYHGYMGISNNMSYMIHIDPSGDAVIVRESGADKLYNPNKKEIAVEESNIIDNDNMKMSDVDFQELYNDKRNPNPKIIKENPDGSGQVEYIRENVRRTINVTADQMNRIKEAIRESIMNRIKEAKDKYR